MMNELVYKSSQYFDIIIIPLHFPRDDWFRILEHNCLKNQYIKNNIKLRREGREEYEWRSRWEMGAGEEV